MVFKISYITKNHQIFFGIYLASYSIAMMVLFSKVLFRGWGHEISRQIDNTTIGILKGLDLKDVLFIEVNKVILQFQLNTEVKLI